MIRIPQRNARGTTAMQPLPMDGVRYRAWMIRSWQTGGSTRMRIEWIARGIEVEIEGEHAADLATRVEEAFDREAGGPADAEIVGAPTGAADRGGSQRTR
jgi:hypothetical protein